MVIVFLSFIPNPICDANHLDVNNILREVIKSHIISVFKHKCKRFIIKVKRLINEGYH